MLLVSEFNNVIVEGLSVALPTQHQPITHFQESFGEEAVKQIREMTGISGFHRAKTTQTASDLGYEAAENLLSRQGVDRSEIGILVFVTQKPDRRLPSTAFILHQRLGLTEDCVCFDLNLACSGFLYGLQTVCSMLKNSDVKKALLITGDTSHRTLSPFDRTMIMLFGDAGSATLVGKGENENPIRFAMRTDGRKFKSIITPAGAYRNRYSQRERVLWSDGIMRSDYDTHMKGMEVFTFSISDVPKLLDEFLKSLETSVETYDTFALHQANIYILKQIARKLKIPMEKIPVTLDRFGNTSCNSIPLVLADFYGAKEEGVTRTMMCGFGAGLSWACCDISIDLSNINPVIFTDAYLDDSVGNAAIERR